MGGAQRGSEGMTPGQLLEIVALVVSATLALWLGLTVALRTSTTVGRLFVLLAITIAAWSTAQMVELLSDSERAISASHALREFLAALGIASVAHLSLLIATEGHPPRNRLRLVAIGYVLMIGLAIPDVADPSLDPTRMATGPMPGMLFGWTWILVRLAALVVAAWWLVAATRAADRTSQRRRQLQAALATVLIGGLGASLRFLPVLGDIDPWVGISLLAVSIALAGYAVFAAAIFFAPAVASRAFWQSLITGFALAVLVAMTLAVDAAGRELAGLDVPLFTGLALVVAVAVYEPMTARLRAATAGGPRNAARERLLRAMGQSALATQPAAAGVEPALVRLGETLGVSAFEVVGPDGERLAGTALQGPPARREPLTANDGRIGELRVGPTDAARTLGPADEALIRQTAAFVGAALRTGRQEEAQLDSLAGLSVDRADVEQQATALHAAMVLHGTRPAGLTVFALGPLRVERQGRPVERWGGDKAGSRQAEALFAFLLDRGERGVAKDEVLELVWPDTDIERADLAFHRTMVGLRQTVDPSRTRGGESAIRFRNDRYRLSPEVLDWSDVEAFLARLEAAAGGRRAARAPPSPRGGAGPVSRRLPRRLPVLRRQQPRRGAARAPPGPGPGPADRPGRGLRVRRRPRLGRRRVPGGDHPGGRPVRARRSGAGAPWLLIAAVSPQSGRIGPAGPPCDGAATGTQAGAER